MAWSADRAAVARIGMNLAAARESSGMARLELAEATGYHRTYIADIEKGRRNPSVVVIIRLALHLGVSPGALLEGTAELIDPIRPDRTTK